jgi:tRNA A-37 threonylcarbamoyl transferase component Bud32
MSETNDGRLPDVLVEGLVHMGLISSRRDLRSAERLTGGVSSEIWKIELAGKTICVKRALPKLLVAETWEAPVERNRYEARWYREANDIVPGIAPQVLASDDDLGIFAMQYLSPEHYALWKLRLSQGDADPHQAAAVGRALGRIHAGTAGRPDIAAQFDTTSLFEELRLSPYLRFTATRHPDLASRLVKLADEAREKRIALVHGDVSPKNILLGAKGPVILDAECAWYGDPAFDPAFCLTHLILKAVWVPAARTAFASCFEAFWSAYLNEVGWEEPAGLAKRVAAFLPAIVLARIDGKSPVEYITEDVDRARVRAFAIPFIEQPAGDPRALAADWYGEDQ